MWARLHWAAAGLALLVAAAWSVHAAEWRSPTYNCVIRAPEEDGWQISEKSPLPDCVVTLTADDGDVKRAAHLMVWKLTTGKERLDRQFVRDFDAEFFKPPVRRLETERVLVKGVPAYQALGVAAQAGRETYVFTCVMLTGGYAYRLDIVTQGVDVRTDDKALRLLDGFGFIQPPPPQKDPGAESNRRLYGGFGLVVGVIILIAATRMIRRRRSRPPARPNQGAAGR